MRTHNQKNATHYKEKSPRIPLPPMCLPRPAPCVATLLSSCRHRRHLEQTHSLIIRKGLEQYHLLINRFINLAAALAAPSYAAAVFSRVAAPNLFLWNSLLKAHSHHPYTAIPFFTRMLRSPHPPSPDAFTFPTLLKSISNSPSPALSLGASIHAAIVRSGLDSDVFVATALVDFYGKSHNIVAARTLFKSMQHRNEVSWTAMLTSYLIAGDLVSARHIFDIMPNRNIVCWNAIIDGYVKSGDMAGACRLFDEMPDRDRVSVTSMIDGYTKGGDMASARVLFDQSSDRDVFLWSVMISGYARNGRPGEAVKLFLEMYNLGVRVDEFIVVGLMSACAQLGSLPLVAWVDAYVMRSSVDVKAPHVLTGLIDMNAKSGSLERAAMLFESMLKRDLISYCSMMQGYSIHGMGAKAVELFARMLTEGLVPDDVAFTVVLTACSYSGLVEEGNKYFYLMKNGYSMDPSPEHYACMVHLLGRAGYLEKAYDLIKMSPVEPNAGAWGALLGACQLHGDIQLGKSVARRLFELEPLNAGNYVSLSNIYAAADKWGDVSDLRSTMNEMGVRKKPGSTRI